MANHGMSGTGHIDKRWLKENPDRVQDFDINVKLLNEGIISKYSLSTTEYGKIANAYVIDPISRGVVKVNPKNALLIGLEALAFYYNQKEKSVLYNPDARMSRLMTALMPKQDDVSIDSIFYKRLFTKSCRRDDIRNCRTGVPYQACFQYNTKNRFKIVDGAIGGQYKEEDIQAFADTIYTEVSEPYVTNGKMTPVTRAIISETVDVRLQSEYGWAFDHQEYIGIEVNKGLIDRIVAAFPTNNTTIKQLGTLLNVDASINSTFTAKAALETQTINPLAENPSWNKMMQKELTHSFDIIDEHLLDEIKAAPVNNKRQILQDAVTKFVTETNNQRLYQTSFVRNKVMGRDRYIDTEKDIEQITKHLVICLDKIESGYVGIEHYNSGTLNVMMLVDILPNADDEIRSKVLNLLESSTIYQAVA